MVTSSNGNIFRVTGPLCGEFTGPGEFPTQRPVTRSFDVSLICVCINDWVNNGEAGDLRCHRRHYGVNVMSHPTQQRWGETEWHISTYRYNCYFDAKLKCLFHMSVSVSSLSHTASCGNLNSGIVIFRNFCNVFSSLAHMLCIPDMIYALSLAVR